MIDFPDASPAGAAAVDWPAGAISWELDLGAGVHVLEFPGPPERVDAPTVVCLHGLGGSALNFGLLGPLLATTHRVVVPDLLGHGSSGTYVSPRADGPLEEQLDLVTHVIDRYCHRPIVLLGHSIGGVLAQLLAARAPETVSRLVLLDPPVPHPTRWAVDPRLTVRLALLRTPGVRAAVARRIARLDPEQLAHRQLDDATPHADRIPRSAVDASVAENRRRAARPDTAAAQRVQWHGILAVVALLARAADWRRRLAALTVPTLWLQGQDDRLVAAAAAAALAEALPDRTFLTRPGVGHLPHLEDPSWTAATILGWLDAPRRSPS